VPQGRRLFTSLTVDEHLEIVGAPSKADWTPDRVYELFPRLAERKNVSGTSLSGGEQEMLSIGRALLTNPRLLIMDEPSEGLAPTVVETLIETIKDLAAAGMGLLVVEQNLGVATTLAERQLVMVAGAIATETTAEALLADPEAQKRYLGVEPLPDAA
jgi:branched-chain amino acid transport system ATP-binding protein